MKDCACSPQTFPPGRANGCLIPSCPRAPRDKGIPHEVRQPLAELAACQAEIVTQEKRIDEILAVIKPHLLGCIIRRHGKTYKVTEVRAYGGKLHGYGVRHYPETGRDGVRDFDLWRIDNWEFLGEGKPHEAQNR